MARREGLIVSDVICESKSAKEPDLRPEFKRLLTLIEKGKVQGILCWKLDRLSRNPIDSARIQWFLQKGKIQCIKASDRIYLPDDNALVLAVEQGFANQYVRDLAKNVRRGLESKAQKGWYPTVAPIGYLNTKKGQKGFEEITIDPERFQIIRKMWDFMLTGNYTVMQVLRIATNEWNLRSPAHGKLGNKRLATSYAYRIFSNVFYTGNFIYGNKFYQGKQPAMITMAEYERVQSILHKTSQPRAKIHEFPFTGIMRCERCGAAVTATEKIKLVKTTGKLKTYTYYHCTGRVGIDDCPSSRVSLADLESQVEKILSENTISQEFYDLGMSILHANEGKQLQEYEMIYSRQQAQINDLKKKLDRLLGFLINETITEEQYNSQKAELEKELGIEKVKLGQIEMQCVDYDRLMVNAFTFSKACLHAFNNGDIQTRRDILGNIGSNQRLNEKNLYVDIHSWLTAIKKTETEYMEEKMRFELKNVNEYKPVYTFESVFPLLCASEDEVRNANPAINEVIPSLLKKIRLALMQSTDPPHIPDLSKWM